MIPLSSAFYKSLVQKDYWKRQFPFSIDYLSAPQNTITGLLQAYSVDGDNKIWMAGATGNTLIYSDSSQNTYTSKTFTASGNIKGVLFNGNSGLCFIQNGSACALAYTTDGGASWTENGSFVASGFTALSSLAVNPNNGDWTFCIQKSSAPHLFYKCTGNTVSTQTQITELDNSGNIYVNMGVGYGGAGDYRWIYAKSIGGSSTNLYLSDLTGTGTSNNWTVNEVNNFEFIDLFIYKNLLIGPNNTQTGAVSRNYGIIIQLNPSNSLIRNNQRLMFGFPYNFGSGYSVRYYPLICYENERIYFLPCNCRLWNAPGFSFSLKDLDFYHSGSSDIASYAQIPFEYFYCPIPISPDRYKKIYYTNGNYYVPGDNTSMCPTIYKLRYIGD